MKPTKNIIKRILSEETEIQNVDTIIDDVDIDKAIDVEEEIEIPEVILNLEKNPPKWYIKLKRRIALRTARRSKRPNYKGQSDYKRKKQNKKVAKYVPLGVMAEATIVAALYVFNKKFKNFVNNLGNSFLSHMGSDARIEESRDYSDKEQVKDMIADNLTNEIISMLDYGDRMGMDVKLTYEDLNDILTNVFENAEFLFMNDDSYLNEQRSFNRMEVDIDVVLELMKYKYGYGDLSSGWIEEFEEELGNETLSTINSLEYADLLHRFIQDAEEESRRYDDRINYNSGHAGYDDRNYQYGNKPDDYYGEDENPYLNEQKEYSDNHYDYSPYRGINTTKIEKEIKKAIRTKSHSLSYRNGEKTVTYNDPNLVNPHLEQDIQRLAERILYNIYQDVLTYVGENYEGDIEAIMNGEFD